MKYRPLPFSGPMIRTLDRKTVTRRTRGLQEINKDPDAWTLIGSENGIYLFRHTNGLEKSIKCPFGVPGDRFWVKETWAKALGSGFCKPLERYEKDDGNSWGIGAIYKATPHKDYNPCKWNPSMFMPRWASRYLLEGTGIRVERLQDITDEDATREGLSKLSKDGGRTWKYGIPDRDGLPGNDDDGWHWENWRISPVDAFQTLWDSINAKKYPWKLNPWVWAIEFKKF